MGLSETKKKELVIELRCGIKSRVNKAILEIYKAIEPKVTHFVLRNSGTRADAEDLIQEGLATIYMLLRSSDFDLQTDVVAYLYGVCKNKWYKKIKKDKRLPLSEFRDYKVVEEEKDDREEEMIALIADMVCELSPECQKLLQSFYFDKKTMKTIAQELSYNSEGVVKSKKYKCMTALRKKVLDHPRLKELLS